MTAQSDAERRAAVEITPARKMREIRMALTLDKTFTKAEILTLPRIDHHDQYQQRDCAGSAPTAGGTAATATRLGDG